LHKDDILPSVPLPKGFKRSKDQLTITRKKNNKKVTLGKRSTLKAQEKKSSLDASSEQEDRRGHMAVQNG